MSRLTYNVAETAAALGTSEEWVRRALRTNRLRGIRDRKTWLVPATSIAEFTGIPVRDVNRLMKDAAA